MVGRPPSKRGRPAKSVGRGRPSKSGRRTRNNKDDDELSSGAEAEAIASPNDNGGEPEAKTAAVASDEEKADVGEASGSASKKSDTQRKGRKRKAELISLERREPEMDVKERGRCRFLKCLRAYFNLHV